MSESGCINYDQIRSADREGTGSKFQMFTGSGPTAGNTPTWDANGNLIDSGSATTGTVTHTGGALTADQPVFGAGGGDVKVGTKRGNNDTVQCADSTTSPTSGDFASFDANANVKDSGVPSTGRSDGQLLIGSSADGLWHPATLTAGTNVTITNGGGSITIASSGGGGGTGVPYPIQTTVTDPNSATWAWGDGPGSTGAAQLNTGTGYINLFLPFNNDVGGIVSRVLSAAPTTPYTIEIAFIPHFLMHNSTYRVGFCWRDSGGKYVIAYVRNDSSGLVWEWDWFNSATSGNSARKTTFLDGGVMNTQNGVWLKFTNDGSNLKMFIGTGLNTPNNWQSASAPWFSEGATSFLAANPKPGFFLANSGTSLDVGMTVFHWKQS